MSFILLYLSEQSYLGKDNRYFVWHIKYVPKIGKRGQTNITWNITYKNFSKRKKLKYLEVSGSGKWQTWVKMEEIKELLGFNSLADQGIFTHSVGDRVLSWQAKRNEVFRVSNRTRYQQRYKGESGVFDPGILRLFHHWKDGISSSCWRYLVLLWARKVGRGFDIVSQRARYI